MQAVLTILPIVLRLAQDGTLLKIVGAAVQLITLLEPVLADPERARQIEDAIKALAAVPKPGQPEDPAMERAAGHH